MTGAILTQDRRIRVFLSSRLVEFADERQALVRMIHKMGLTPIFFEETPRPHPPRNLYSAFLEQSDIFIGVYGTGYGWIDESGGMTISGLHDEWVLSSEMPRIVFVQETSDQREPRLTDLIKEIGETGVSFNLFRTRSQLVNRARDAIALCISERFLGAGLSFDEPPQNYANQVELSLGGMPILRTSFYRKQVQPAVANHTRVFLAGGIGSGKTALLYLLSLEPKHVYLPLRQQSLLGALIHVCRHLAPMVGEQTKQFLSAEEGRLACESLLRRVSATLLIDDVDQAPDIAADLISLPPGVSRIVLAGRSIPARLPPEFRTLHCPGFTDSESEEYVSSALPDAPVTGRVALELSCGNPLYLRYYVQTSPGSVEPPQSLDDYHANMWASLDARQKELVSAVSLCESALTFEQLGQVLTACRGVKTSGIAAMDEAKRLTPLLSIAKKSVQVFHSAFQEFVFREVNRVDLAREIHRNIASAFTKKSEWGLRVIHSARGGLAQEVYDDLLPMAHWSEITGRTNLAREMIASALWAARAKKDWHVLGLGLHQSANLKQHVRSMPSALLSSRLSEKMLQRSQVPGVSLIARASRAIFLLELDRGDEAETILREVAEEYREAGVIANEAMVRVNLAFVYVRRGRMAECATQCQKAIPIFERTGDSYGLGMALLNLQNYYIVSFDREKQLGCLRKLKALSLELDSPRLQMAVCNGLTILYRRASKYKKAERVCLKAIALAQMHGIRDVEVINVGNLGNVYRDEARYDKARACYEEVKRLGKEMSSCRHVAWSHELIATIVEREGDISNSLEIGEKALVLWRKIDEVHREAATEEDQARRFHKLAKPANAAKSCENAARAWCLCGVYEEAAEEFCRAIGQWVKAEEYQEAARCFTEAWLAFAQTHADEALGMMVAIGSDAISIAPHLDVVKLFESLPHALVASSTSSLVRDAIAITSAIARTQGPQCDEYERLFCSLKNRFHADPSIGGAVALAFAIEQAPEMVLQEDGFRELCQACTDSDTGLLYSKDRIAGERWLVFFPAANAPVVEVVADYEFPGVRAAAAVAALLLWAKRRWLAEQIERWGWRRIGITLFAVAAEECEARGVPMPAQLAHDFPAVLCKRSDLQDLEATPLPLIVRSDFLVCADETARPDNRASVGLMLQVCEGVMENFTGGVAADEHIKEIRFQFVCEVFGLRKVGQESSEISGEFDDADDLADGF